MDNIYYKLSQVYKDVGVFIPFISTNKDNTERYYFKLLENDIMITDSIDDCIKCESVFDCDQVINRYKTTIGEDKNKRLKNLISLKLNCENEDSLDIPFYLNIVSEIKKILFK